MPSRTTSPQSGLQQGNQIDKLDFDASRQKTTSPTLKLDEPSGPSESGEGRGQRLIRDDGSFFSDVVDGVIERDRRAMRQRLTKYIAFASAVLSCLCAGSITAFSLYGPLFLRHLRYSQYQVNAVSTTAELAMYLPVPLAGWLCDRYNPRPLSAFAGVCFGLGYALAAGVYRAGPVRVMYRLVPESNIYELKKEGWPFGVMIFAFVLIGLGTMSMYLTAVTTCAKNFGKGRHKGITLAIPIAAFGLSGLWQSLVGSYCFKDESADGNVDVFRYFCFLSGLLFAVGIIGSLCLRIVGEEQMIEDAMDEMERSGIFEEEQRSLLHRDEGISSENNYGSTAPRPNRDDTESVISKESSRLHRSKFWRQKYRLLNTETRLFLSDSTAYLLAAGFFLTSGPGEAYLNNIGTLIHTVYPPATNPPNNNSPAVHVSIVALTSTIARLATGTLADLAGPSKPSDETPVWSRSRARRGPITLPRPVILIVSAGLFSIGQILLATPLVQTHPLTLTLNTALVGFGYGAIFSLTPMIISVVWGVENFGTNWGIVATMPAIGAALWGVIYSAVYSAGRDKQPNTLGEGKGQECYGSQCYQSTFAAMAVASWIAIVLWILAWRGWRRRGVVV